ncbi:SLC13 family permease [Arthrobacter sp. BE255]|uniref:GntP family permease n=1 Tax=Arthrobacter sp. BE255 TaxID=2817721 RepID=UPI0028638FE6|nr:SLC13 family permease [Arthrobacter sp. BE255]MDR7161959.1 GntP family gluconate:H+ symporter [Arthrobacter sp. BE255]
MDVEFEHLSTAPLLLICAGAIAVLLFLILKVKMHAVVALLIVSVATAFATRIPTGSIMDLLLGGLGETLGDIAFLIAFGVMFARLIEFSGGTKVLVDALVGKLGEKRAPLALGIASLVFGIPIFFDAAFLVMLPLYLAVARRVGGSILLYVLGPAAALSMMHMLMPPHPGVTTATVLLGADIGLVMLFGLIIAVPSWYLGGHLLGARMGRRFMIPVPEAFSGGPQVDSPYTSPGRETPGSKYNADAPAAGTSGATTAVRTETETVAAPPRISTVLSLICLPLVLILLNTGTSMVAKLTQTKDAQWVQLLQLIGSVPIALLITVVVASYVLGTRRGVGQVFLEDMLDNALKPICSVLLVVGAGGMFAAILEASGIGDAMAGALDASGLPLPLALFLICGIMSAAVGSTTVSITTAAGLMGATIAAADPNPLQLAALVLVMAGGSGILPHVNDAGFWLMSRLLGMTVSETLKTWTVVKTMIGVFASLFATVLYLIAGL